MTNFSNSHGEMTFCFAFSSYLLLVVTILSASRFMALNSLKHADVPLRNCSLALSFSVICTSCICLLWKSCIHINW